jgi:hypothetical protein
VYVKRSAFISLASVHERITSAIYIPISGLLKKKKVASITHISVGKKVTYHIVSLRVKHSNSLPLSNVHRIAVNKFVIFIPCTSPKYIDYLDASHNSPQATNFSCIKQHSNHLGLQDTTLGYRATTSNIEILELFQSKALLMIVDAPWFVPNAVIQMDLQTPTVKN